MRRRRLLALLAAAPPSLAGCLGESQPAGTTSDSTTTRATTGRTAETTTAPTETTTTEEYDVSVHAVAVEPEVVTMTTPDSIATTGDRGEQFVVADVTADDLPWPDRDAFDLVVDGDAYAPVTDLIYGTRLWGRGRAYDGGDGWLAFRLPNPVAADAAALAWPGGEHALDASALARLARPPTTFEVREFTAPETAAPGDTVTARLTVANVGDADGTFVGALNRVGPMVAHTPEAAISLDVAAGATATREFTHTLDAGGEGEMTLRLHWRDGSRSRTTDVTEE